MSLLFSKGVLIRSLSSRSRSGVNAAGDLKPGVYLVAFDVTLDGKRYGPWFDVIISAEP